VPNNAFRRGLRDERALGTSGARSASRRNGFQIAPPSGPVENVRYDACELVTSTAGTVTDFTPMPAAVRRCRCGKLAMA
jgi:hypothetical protein